MSDTGFIAFFIADAFWYPIGKLSREMMFEDHYDIIDLMLNKKSIGKL